MLNEFRIGSHKGLLLVNSVSLLVLLLLIQLLPPTVSLLQMLLKVVEFGLFPHCYFVGHLLLVGSFKVLVVSIVKHYSFAGNARVVYEALQVGIRNRLCFAFSRHGVVLFTGVIRNQTLVFGLGKLALIFTCGHARY